MNKPNPKPYPNPKPILVDTLFTTVDEPSTFHFTLQGAVGPLRANEAKSANADFQSTHNTREATPTTAQNLTSRTSKLEKLFADEKTTYTFITAGIHSQYFCYMIKFASLMLVIRILSVGRFP